MKMAVLLIAAVASLLHGADTRFRLERRFPPPRGILENHWAGDPWAFFHRTSFEAGKLSGVLMIEKDPGEGWGDLVAGGLGWHEGRGLQSVTAGFLRLRMALGLTADHGGGSISGDPLSLVKPPVHRNLIEPASSPGDCDCHPLTGAGLALRSSGLDISLLQAFSRMDRSGTGLHRTASEILQKGAVNESFSFARVSGGDIGLSGALISRACDSTEVSGRLGVDLRLEGESGVLTGEASLGFHRGSYPLAFLAGVYSDAGDFRHSLSASRCPSSFPSGRSSVPLGASHDLAGGYGIRWKPGRRTTITSGFRVADRGGGIVTEAGVQAEVTPFPGTTVTQKLTASSSGGETTLRGSLGASWRPGRNTTLTVRLPVTACSRGDSTLWGAGAEFRMKHSFLPGLDATLSASAADTQGYPSRIYIYKLSFPGEFGSAALYDRCAAFQASVSATLGEGWLLRVRIGRFHWYDRENIGSGYEQTSGSTRTETGLQLDWSQ